MEELGEDTEELANGFSKYAEELKALTGVDIVVEGTTDTFKDLYDIMNDIAGVWDNLSDTQQARTAEILGGTRQLQVIASIINNWKDAEGALADAMEASGEATRANDLYMQTTTAHVNQMKAAFQTLSYTVIDSGLVKFFIDLATATLKVLTFVGKLVNSLGGLGVVGGATLSGLFLKADKVVRLLDTLKNLKFVQPFISFFSTLKSGKNILDAFNVALTTTTGKIGLLIAAITAIAGVINLFISKHRESIEASIKAGQEAATETEEIHALAEEYFALSQVNADSDDAIAAREAIIEKLGLERWEVQNLIDKYGEYGFVAGALYEDIQKQIPLIRQSIEDAKRQAQESYRGLGTYYGDLYGDNYGAFTALDRAGYVSDFDNGIYKLPDDVVESYDTLYEMLLLLESVGYKNSEVYRDLKEKYDALTPSISTAKSQVEALTNALIEEAYYADGGIPNTLEGYKVLRDSIIESVEATKDMSVSTEDVTRAVDDFLSKQPGLESFAKRLAEGNDALAGLATAYEGAKSGLSDVGKLFDNITESMKNVTSLQELVANGFAVDVEKAMELAKVYPEILDNAQLAADGQLQLNEDVVNAILEGKQSELQASIDTKIAELEAERTGLEAKLAFAQAELDLANDVSHGKADITKDELEYRVNAGNLAAEAMIAAGYNEADAYRAAAMVMAQNTDGLNKVIASASSDISTNMSSSAKEMADAFARNAIQSGTSVNSLIDRFHQLALAVKGAENGQTAGNKSGVSGAYGVNTGGKGKSTSTSNKASSMQSVSSKNTSSGAFAVDSIKTSAIASFSGVYGSGGWDSSFNLTSFISDIQKDIDNYRSAIAQVDGQISALQALRNATNEKFKNSGSGGSGSGGSGGSGSGGSGSSGSGSSSSSDADNWFKRLYNQHKHYVEMDQETQGDFLLWLDKAYKEAYKQGIITLDEFNKYEEEIYKGFQKIEDEAKSMLEKLVEYRVKMLKQEYSNQKDALNSRLSALKEFYSKQKELLQDQASEEDYLDEQAAKRKTVNDIQAQIAQLQYDNSAWAQKRRLELEAELKEAQKDLQDYEDDHALELALDALDNAYDAQEAQLQAQINAIDELLNDPQALYNKALIDIQNNTQELYNAMLEFNRKYGDGLDETVSDMWEDAYKANEEYRAISGMGYAGTDLGNYTGYVIPVAPDMSVPTSSTTSTSKSSSASSTASKTSSAAPALSNGSTVTVKPSATNFSPRSGSVRMASFVPGGQYTVYDTKGNEVLIGRNGVYTGWIYKSDIVGYKRGTKSAAPGLHRINEDGEEFIFSSGNGETYRMFSGGEKVLNAKATNFLYDFATNGAKVLSGLAGSSGTLFGGLAAAGVPANITMGDIIINGNTNNATVSEIRRAQREQVDMILRSFNKLQTK